MYTAFFGLNEKPFSISPDPRYLYLSRRHADALAHLIYGISESGGFIQLTGEVGTGKTTLIRSLLEQLPEKAEIALILNPQLSTREFLQAICEELRIDTSSQDSVKGLIDCLNAQLLQANTEDRRIVLIVDEAQTLSPELLEQVRLLTNLETAKKKLLQIILIGQPELRELLDRPELRQVAQRVTGRYHLEPLSYEDTGVYVRHRMKVAGTQADVFKQSAIRKIYKQSRGIPRLINIIADRALLAAYTQDRASIDGRLVQHAAAEVFGQPKRRAWWLWALGAAGMAIFIFGTTNLLQGPSAELEGSAAAEVAAQLRADDSPAVAAPSETQETVENSPRDTLEMAMVEPTQSLPEVFARVGDNTTTTTAAQRLFELWGLSYDASAGPACGQAELQGAKCLFLVGGSIGQLRRLNLPALLTLSDSDGGQHSVVMASLGYDDAEIVAGPQSYRVNIIDLTHHWYGEHMVLWKPSIGSGPDLAPGVRDDRVRWLRQSIASIMARSDPNPDSTLYDEELAAVVRRYQQTRRLTVDGIIGAQTQIAINTDLGHELTPRLSRAD